MARPFDPVMVDRNGAPMDPARRIRLLTRLENVAVLTDMLQTLSTDREPRSMP